MALKDLIRNAGSLFSRVTADMTRRPDGGTSHYRPLRKKPGAGETAPAEAQDPRYAHTGFTGMNPPADYGQGAYGQADYGQAAYDRTGYSQGGWFGSRETAETGYVGQGSFGGTGFTQAQQGNISYMPGVEPSRDRGTVHVEHIITLTGLKSCYDAIEFMKDGETLIVMLDAIANESESMRCQDMLAGAAFTLGCSVRLLPGARIVIIAPEGVKILPEQAVAAPARPAEIPPVPQGAPAAAPVPRRERRTSPNTVEWTAARNGQLDNYNPYTGTMPAAAGGYARFGGYGI